MEDDLKKTKELRELLSKSIEELKQSILKLEEELAATQKKKDQF